MFCFFVFFVCLLSRGHEVSGQEVPISSFSQRAETERQQTTCRSDNNHEEDRGPSGCFCCISFILLCGKVLLKLLLESFIKGCLSAHLQPHRQTLCALLNP